MTGNTDDRKLVPRRDFLKYSSLLTAGAAAYAVYVTTDAKGEPPLTALAVSGNATSDAYGYQGW